MSDQAMSHRRSQQSHPWITYTFDMTRLDPTDWMNIGEAWSKCDYIAGVPLQPAVAQMLHGVYLAKGVHATTQIEGNTLSEAEVKARLGGDLWLPDSQEYLGREVDNILKAYNLITDDLIAGDIGLTPGRIRQLNRIVLDGLPLDTDVEPGGTRRGSVIVGNVYRGAPWEDCDYLLDRLCSWLDSMVRDVPDGWHRPMKLIRAILAHLYLAWIHPFGDGNGRTARLVEFQLLAAAGFPTPACQLLSNYYNRTRQMYYRALAETSRFPYHVERFVSYALRGFVEELREQLSVIRAQQHMVTWNNFVHESFSGRTGVPARRQRDLVLALPVNGVPANRVRRLTPELAEQYAGKQQKTLSRDLNTLEKLGLVERKGATIRPRIEILSAFLPLCHNDTTSGTREPVASTSDA